jgi:hypothetical protein
MVCDSGPEQPIVVGVDRNTDPADRRVVGECLDRSAKHSSPADPAVLLGPFHGLARALAASGGHDHHGNRSIVSGRRVQVFIHSRDA